MWRLFHKSGVAVEAANWKGKSDLDSTRYYLQEERVPRQYDDFALFTPVTPVMPFRCILSF